MSDQKPANETAILIPCFNESGNIIPLVDEIKISLGNALTIVINDGSSDQTGNEARAAGAEVLDLPVNLGVGGAIQTGFKFALKQNVQRAVKIDGDGQHPPEEAQALLSALSIQEADIVIGSRFIDPKGYQSTFTRRLGIHFLSFICRILTGIPITDPTSGFRAYSRKAIDFFSENYPDFDYPEPEEIVLASKNGLKISEVPVNMRPRKHGVSTLTSSISCYYMIKVSLAMLFIFLRKPKY